LDQRGLWADPRQLSKIKLSDLLLRFRDQETPRRGGGINEAIVINAFLRQSLADLSLATLRPDHFAEYRDQRLRAVRPGTVLRELGLIQCILEKARTEWHIPLSDIHLSKRNTVP
jgi:hypothetical protein